MRKILIIICAAAVCLAGLPFSGANNGTYIAAANNYGETALPVSTGNLSDTAALQDCAPSKEVSADEAFTPSGMTRVSSEGEADEAELLQNAFSAKADDFSSLEASESRFESDEIPGAMLIAPESSENSDFTVKPLKRSVSFADNTLSFMALVFNNTASDADAVIYYAVYSENGTLVKLVSAKASVAAGSYSEISFDSSLDIPADKIYTERLFVWDTDMRILSDAAVLSLGAISDTCNSLILSQNKLELKVTDTAETALLSAQVYPSGLENVSLIFYSSDESVARVSQDGTVTAVSPGTADIYVYTSDFGAAAVCRVTVTGYQTVAITLSHYELNMFTEKQYFLYAVISPETGEKINWYTSDASVAEVSQGGVVYSHDRGTAVITAEVGEIRSNCTVTVYNESDYTGRVAAYFESNDQPGRISSGSDAGGKSYGCFQFASASDVPRDFAYWIIFSGYNPVIGWRIIDAYELENCYSEAFDSTWRAIAAEDEAEFRSCQNAYAKTQYYDSEYNKLKASPEDGGLGLDLDSFGLGVKAAVWSRAIQHGVTGAFNVISRAYAAIGGFYGKGDREIVAAIYAESGATVDSPPSSSAIAINDSTETARSNGLVGKYMKYFSRNSSSIQVGVWVRLNKTEPEMVYKLIDSPPVNITPQD